MNRLFLIPILCLSFSALADEPSKVVGKIDKYDLIDLENQDLHIERVVNQANEQVKPLIAPFVAKRSAIYKKYAIVDGDKYDADGTIHHAKTSVAPPSAAAAPPGRLKVAAKPKPPTPAPVPVPPQVPAPTPEKKK